MLADFVRLISPLSCSLAELRGVAKYSTQTLRAIYAGSGRNLEFLRQYFFQQSTLTAIAARPMPWRLRAALARRSDSVDLWLIDRPALWAKLSPPFGDIRVPAWIRQQIQLPALLPASGRLLPRLLEKEIRRHTRQQQYSVDFVSDAATWREFYRDFYRPYISARFGEGAILVPEHQFLRHRDQTLARLHANNQWIAGLLLRQHGRLMRLEWFGLRGNAMPPGASETLDAASIRFAYEQGARVLLMGNSRPCLSDGVLRYKAKFGASILATRFPQAELAIGIRHASPVVLQCIERQPLIGLDGIEPQLWQVAIASNLQVTARLVPLLSAARP